MTSSTSSHRNLKTERDCEALHVKPPTKSHKLRTYGTTICGFLFLATILGLSAATYSMVKHTHHHLHGLNHTLEWLEAGLHDVRNDAHIGQNSIRNQIEDTRRHLEMLDYLAPDLIEVPNPNDPEEWLTLIVPPVLDPRVPFVADETGWRESGYTGTKRPPPEGRLDGVLERIDWEKTLQQLPPPKITDGSVPSGSGLRRRALGVVMKPGVDKRGSNFKLPVPPEQMSDSAEERALKLDPLLASAMRETESLEDSLSESDSDSDSDDDFFITAPSISPIVIEDNVHPDFEPPFDPDTDKPVDVPPYPYCRPQPYPIRRGPVVPGPYSYPGRVIPQNDSDDESPDNAISTPWIPQSLPKTILDSYRLLEKVGHEAYRRIFGKYREFASSPNYDTLRPYLHPLGLLDGLRPYTNPPVSQTPGAAIPQNGPPKLTEHTITTPLIDPSLSREPERLPLAPGPVIPQYGLPEVIDNKDTSDHESDEDTDATVTAPLIIPKIYPGDPFYEDVDEYPQPDDKHGLSKRQNTDLDPVVESQSNQNTRISGGTLAMPASEKGRPHRETASQEDWREAHREMFDPAQEPKKSSDRGRYSKEEWKPYSEGGVHWSND
ncbi:hypothetical protein QBC34DRAFT_405869, partial [Podospora aff. communis PSN243]